ncbi:hypothetical protein N7470_000995 [Penicillium chermesinum]|nr:hypothetical protein N7470_000995 [Penicillium chermesinum]
MTNFEKSVKGATKLKLAAPKSKYVETILVATHSGDAGVAEVFRTLQHRLRDSAWTIVFKALIIVHLMIREGQEDAVLIYLSDNPKKIAPSNFSEGKVTAMESYMWHATDECTVQRNLKAAIFDDMPTT